MRLNSALSGRHFEFSAPAAPRAPSRDELHNPFHGWLNTLCIGAMFGIAMFLASTALNLFILTSGVRGLPRRPMMDNAYLYLSLGIAAAQWISVWLLTTDDPSPHRSSRVRATVLRMAATFAFLILAAFAFRLLNDWRIFAFRLFTLLQGLNLLIAVVLWMHLSSLATRIGLRDVRWRAVVAMFGYGLTFALFASMQQWLFLSPGFRVHPPPQMQSLFISMLVLWSTVGALVMLRFALGFRAAIHRDARARLLARV